MKSDLNKKLDAKLRVAILQRVCTSYRKGLFQRLDEDEDVTLRIFIGDDIPNSKVKSPLDLSGVDIVKLPTRFIHIGKRIFVNHKNLYHSLKMFQPDVIICEGESNVLSYLKAIVFKWMYSDVKLIHWSLGGLPGEQQNANSIIVKLKLFLHRPFDFFIAYSNFGKSELVRLGHSAEHIIVAVNVSDVDFHLEQAEKLKYTVEEARAHLDLPNKYTALFVGAIDDDKRLDVLLEVAQQLDPQKFNIVLVGDGEYYQELKKKIEDNNLKHMFLPGRADVELPVYYRSADVFVLPGRGGMVISEAMAYGLPVIVYQADGVELDLIVNNETGLILKDGTVDEFAESIQKISLDTEKSKTMGITAQNSVREKFNRAAMVSNILKAIKAAANN